MNSDIILFIILKHFVINIEIKFIIYKGLYGSPISSYEGIWKPLWVFKIFIGMADYLNYPEFCLMLVLWERIWAVSQMPSVPAVQMYLEVKSSGWCWQLRDNLGGNSLITSGRNAIEKKRMFCKTDVLATVGKKNKVNIFQASLPLNLQLEVNRQFFFRTSVFQLPEAYLAWH